MTTIESVCGVLAATAPLRLAESWDNVGLLVGDRAAEVSRIMTCLTVTPSVVQEAEEQNVDLLITHHPLPFKSISRITTDSIVGGMLLKLIGAGVAVYSAHTAFDSAASGINQMWAELLELQGVAPLGEPNHEGADLGVDGPGRLGRLEHAEPLGDLVARAAAAVGASAPRRVGDAEQPVSKIALACGSGGDFLPLAKRRGCDAMITGEASFHTCLEAESLGIGLGLMGHYDSERFAMERLAEQLAGELPSMTIWCSRNERDPIAPG